jgi:hypothetical protein
MNTGIAARAAAACIAAIAWAGLALQGVVVYQENSSVLLTLWILFAFFTITTNLLVAVVFTGIAAKAVSQLLWSQKGREEWFSLGENHERRRGFGLHQLRNRYNRTVFRSAWVVAGTMLSILLVGVIYALLLHGLTELSGGSAVANVLVHMVTPVVVPLFWIFFVDKGGLTWRHPFLWAIYPLAYLAYGLTRGAATGKYPYPFMNVLSLGWEKTALNVFCIAVAFMLSGFATVWIDRRLGPTRRDGGA